MKNHNNKLQDLFELAKKTSVEVGKYLLSKKNEDLKIFKEEGRDIKLEIDREAEALIRKKLLITQISILGEEYGVDDINSQYRWIIDPLDGTANYFRGLDQCCVSIALMNDKKVEVGVVFNFNTNELFAAYAGGGATLNGQKISVSTINKKNKASLITGFPTSEPIEFSSEIISDLKKWKKIRMFGSSALSCAYIAAGRCDAYQEKGAYLWDFAAGICLIEEAGGVADYKKINGYSYAVNFSNGKL